MKITYNPLGHPTTDYSDLDYGTIFRYEYKGYFMKTREERRGDIGRVNAVSLEDYSFLCFDDDDQVTPVDAILTIKGEEP